MEQWYERMCTAEIALASKNPVLEQAYALNDNTSIENSNKALGFYNCLVPKVSSHSFKMDNFLNSFNQKNILKEL